MRLHRRIAAGTALALLMGTAQLVAAPMTLPARSLAQPVSAASPVILAQAQECPPGSPDCQPREERERSEEAPAERPAAEPAPADREQAPAERPAPAGEEPRQPAPQAEQPAPPAEQPAAPAAQPAPPAEQPAPPAERTEPVPPAPAERPAQAEQPAPAEQPAERPAGQGETPFRQPESGSPPAPAERPGGQEAPAQPATPVAPPSPAERAPSDATPAPSAPSETAPSQERPAPQGERPAPSGETPSRPAPSGGSPFTQTPPAQPAPGTTAPTEGAQPGQPGTTPTDGQGAGNGLPENAAPVLDSQKEQARPADGQKPGQGQAPAPGAAPSEQAQPAQPATPPPATDAEAQSRAQPREIEPLRAEEGKRIDESRLQRRERIDGAEVLRELTGGRAVIQIGPEVIVQSDDRRRIRGNAEDYYYEELPRGRTREVITRKNGVQVVTIRDRYGDIVRRSRITPDGREYVLVYADRGGRDDGREFRDPGRDLPPLRLTIPVNEYILDAERVEDPDTYYEFLEQPPVEQVERLYSLDEVRYSARVRDSVRRIDLDTVTFEFGSASIVESEIPRLEGVATAMERLLEQNPAETFLIEGHTDAVGSDIANLGLSDQRAEAVAAALTNVFGIPPENLVTQGYGEQYLKINSQGPERENRRVAIRRITPLVAPVASAQ